MASSSDCSHSNCILLILDKSKGGDKSKSSGTAKPKSDDDDDDTISLSDLIQEDWTTLASGAQLISNDEFPVLFEHVLWGWTDEASNERVSVMIRLASGVSFEDGDVEVQILNPETEDTQALVTFKRSSAFTDPDWFYRMYRHNVHKDGLLKGQKFYAKSHSMMVGFNSEIKTQVKKCGTEKFSKMRIDIGVPCEEALSTDYVHKSMHIATELAPECHNCQTVEDAIRAGMKSKKYLVFHLMGARSNFSKTAAKVRDNDEWVYSADSPTNQHQHQPAAAMPRTRAGKKHRMD